MQMMYGMKGMNMKSYATGMKKLKMNQSRRM